MVAVADERDTREDAELAGDPDALAAKWTPLGFRFAAGRFPRLRRQLGRDDYDQRVKELIREAAELFDPAKRPMFPPLLKHHLLLKLRPVAQHEDRWAGLAGPKALVTVADRPRCRPDAAVDELIEAVGRLTDRQLALLRAAAANDGLDDRAAAMVARVPVTDIKLVRRALFRREAA